jgi:hypothetical protein
LVVVVKEGAEKLRGTVRALSRGLGVEPPVLDERTYQDLLPLLVQRPITSSAREEFFSRLEAARSLLAAGLPNEVLSPLLRIQEGLQKDFQSLDVSALDHLRGRVQKARALDASPVSQEEVVELLKRTEALLEAAYPGKTSTKQAPPSDPT